MRGGKAGPRGNQRAMARPGPTSVRTFRGAVKGPGYGARSDKMSQVATNRAAAELKEGSSSGPDVRRRPCSAGQDHVSTSQRQSPTTGESDEASNETSKAVHQSSGERQRIGQSRSYRGQGRRGL